MKIGGAATNWRLRIRFKMFRTTGNTGGQFYIGLMEAPHAIPVSDMVSAEITAAGSVIVDVLDYATNEWHDVERFIDVTGFSLAGDIFRAGIFMGTSAAQDAITGADILISDFYVDDMELSPGLPQVTAGAAYTLKAQDAGRHIYISTGGVTIPNNADVPFAVETYIMIINNSGSSQTISKGGSVTLDKPGSAGVASLTLTAYGRCELVKVGTDKWHAAGNV